MSSPHFLPRFALLNLFLEVLADLDPCSLERMIASFSVEIRSGHCQMNAHPERRAAIARVIEHGDSEADRNATL